MARSLQAAKVSFQQHPAWVPGVARIHRGVLFANRQYHQLPPRVASKESSMTDTKIANSIQFSSIFIKILLMGAIAETTTKNRWKKKLCQLFKNIHQNVPLSNLKNAILNTSQTSVKCYLFWYLEIQICKSQTKSLEAAHCRSAASTKRERHVPPLKRQKLDHFRKGWATPKGELQYVADYSAKQSNSWKVILGNRIK